LLGWLFRFRIVLVLLLHHRWSCWRVCSGFDLCLALLAQLSRVFHSHLLLSYSSHSLAADHTRLAHTLPQRIHVARRSILRHGLVGWSCADGYKLQVPGFADHRAFHEFSVAMLIIFLVALVCDCSDPLRLEAFIPIWLLPLSEPLHPDVYQVRLGHTLQPRRARCCALCGGRRLRRPKLRYVT